VQLKVLLPESAASALAGVVSGCVGQPIHSTSFDSVFALGTVTVSRVEGVLLSVDVTDPSSTAQTAKLQGLLQMWCWPIS